MVQLALLQNIAVVHKLMMEGGMDVVLAKGQNFVKSEKANIFHFRREDGDAFEASFLTVPVSPNQTQHKQ